MALQSSLTTPDKVETHSDITNSPRSVPVETGGVWAYEVVGYWKTTEETTTSTWTAATRAACISYEEAYAGDGSISISQENKVVNSWQLVLVEQTVTREWVAAE